MDVSPQERRLRGRLLSRFGVANAEVRAAQAQLYEEIVKQTITIDTLKTHKHLLDTDIKIVVNVKGCFLTKELESNYRQPDYHAYMYTDMIKTGFCECFACKRADTLGIRVAGLRFIHALVENEKNLPFIAFLQRSGCDMKPVTLSEEYSPLELAVRSGSEEIVQYYVQHFDSIEFVPTLQKALKESTCRWKATTCISKTLLSAKNVNVSFCEKNTGSLLCSLLQSLEFRCDDNIDHIKVFLEAGADLALADKYGSSPLMIAAHYGCVETVRLLLQHVPNVNTTNYEGDTAMHLAAKWSSRYHYQWNVLDENLAKIIELLLEKGADQ